MTPDLQVAPRERNNFDAIRIAMALLVVWSHCFALFYGTEASEPLSLLTAGTINAGNLGVDVFFTVSGYLITQSMLRSRGPWLFLRKRIRRIYPGFLAATAVCAFVILPLWDVHYDFRGIIKTLGLNLLLQGYFVNDAPFVHNPVHALNGALWSVSFEFWCYLGVLFLWVTGLLKRRSVVLALFVLAVAFHVCCDATGRKPGWGLVGLIIGWPYLWGRMAPFYLIGMLFYFYRAPLSKYIAAASLLTLIAACRFSVITTDIVSPLAIGYLTFYAAFAWRGVSAAKCGDFSYGVYLYGFPIQQILRSLQMSFAVYTISALVLSLLAGIASWYGVERWFERPARLANPDLKIITPQHRVNAQVMTADRSESQGLQESRITGRGARVNRI